MSHSTRSNASLATAIERLRRAGRRGDLVAERLEVRADDVDHVRIVVDREDPACCAAAGSAGALGSSACSWLGWRRDQRDLEHRAAGRQAAARRSSRRTARASCARREPEAEVGIALGGDERLEQPRRASRARCPDRCRRRSCRTTPSSSRTGCRSPAASLGGTAASASRALSTRFSTSRWISTGSHAPAARSAARRSSSTELLAQVRSHHPTTILDDARQVHGLGFARGGRPRNARWRRPNADRRSPGSRARCGHDVDAPWASASPTFAAEQRDASTGC